MFPNIPTRTNKICHDVDVGNVIPVKEDPYRMNPFKKEYLQKEIQYLLQNDFIEPSNSSWSMCVSATARQNFLKVYRLQKIKFCH